MVYVVNPLIWRPDAVNAPPLSPAVRDEVTECLRSLQRGRRVGFPHSRLAPRVGSRCHELFVRDGNRAWVIIVRIDRDAVIVAAVFHRRKTRTSAAVIRGCQRQLAAYDAAAAGANGWRTGSVDDFLTCTDTETALIDIRFALQQLLRTLRSEHGVTQAALASRLSTSQSRVAKIETGAPDVSLDLLIRAILIVGGTRGEVARAIAARGT